MRYSQDDYESYFESENFPPEKCPHCHDRTPHVWKEHVESIRLAREAKLREAVKDKR